MRVRKFVNKKNILNKVTSYDIFKHYISNFKTIGKLFRSELREDKHPTCLITQRGENLSYIDFGNGETYDCFYYLMFKYEINFYEALDIINYDFNLNLIPATNTKKSIKKGGKHFDIDLTKFKNVPTVIKVKIREWNIFDKEYWNKKYGFTVKELKEGKVFPLSLVVINEHYFSPSTLCYGYYFGNYPDGRQCWKIYQPLDKKFKWLSNTDSSILQGYNLLPKTGENLIITKSYKDVLILRKIGIPAVGPSCENIKLTQVIIKELKERFTNISILYDNDLPGINATKKLAAEYNLPYFFMPHGTKDSSDYVEKFSLHFLQNYVEWNLKLLFPNGKIIT